MENVVCERRIGTRRLAGTEWPILDRVERRRTGRVRPYWVVTWGLCNGTADRAKTYRTRRDAVEAFTRGGAS